MGACLLMRLFLPYFYNHGRSDPQGRFSGDTALLVTFAAVGKSDSNRQGLASKPAMDGLPARKEQT